MCLVEGKESPIVLEAESLSYQGFRGWIGVGGSGGEARCCGEVRWGPGLIMEVNVPG